MTKRNTAKQSVNSVKPTKIAKTVKFQFSIKIHIVFMRPAVQVANDDKYVCAHSYIYLHTYTYIYLMYL